MLSPEIESELASSQASVAFGQILRRCIARMSGEDAARNEGATSAFARKAKVPKAKIEEIYRGDIRLQEKEVVVAVVRAVQPDDSKQLITLVAKISAEIAEELSRGQATIPSSSS